jgi:hypothetical protein
MTRRGAVSAYRRAEGWDGFHTPRRAHMTQATGASTFSATAAEQQDSLVERKLCYAGKRRLGGRLDIRQPGTRSYRCRPSSPIPITVEQIRCGDTAFQPDRRCNVSEGSRWVHQPRLDSALEGPGSPVRPRYRSTASRISSCCERPLVAAASGSAAAPSPLRRRLVDIAERYRRDSNLVPPSRLEWTTSSDSTSTDLDPVAARLN